MEEIIILKVITAIIGIAVPFLFKQIMENRKEQREIDKHREAEYKQMRYALQCLSRDRLIQAHDYYTAQGWVGIHTMSALWALYKSYEALGENGVIDSLMEQLKNLPNVDPKSTNKISM